MTPSNSAPHLVRILVVLAAVLSLLVLAGGLYSLRMEKETPDLPSISSLLRRLEQDQPYHEYYDTCAEIRKRGREAIPYLIANFGNTNEIHPTYAVNPLWSLSVKRTTVGVTSLYLIDSIITSEEYPHPAQLIQLRVEPLPQNTKETSREALVRAAELYSAWWAKYRDVDWDKVTVPLPLDQIEIGWYLGNPRN